MCACIYDHPECHSDQHPEHKESELQDGHTTRSEQEGAG